MSLRGINIESARSRVANLEANGKLAIGSDNVCSGRLLVNRTFLPRKRLNLLALRRSNPLWDGKDEWPRPLAVPQLAGPRGFCAGLDLVGQEVPWAHRSTGKEAE